eukprot:3079167-Rhodomonas_salina.1
MSSREIAYGAAAPYTSWPRSGYGPTSAVRNVRVCFYLPTRCLSLTWRILLSAYAAVLRQLAYPAISLRNVRHWSSRLRYGTDRAYATTPTPHVSAYAMPGTDLAYGATRAAVDCGKLLGKGGGAEGMIDGDQVTCPMSGTRIAYCDMESGGTVAREVCSCTRWRGTRPPILLRPCYALSGTDMSYHPTACP